MYRQFFRMHGKDKTDRQHARLKGPVASVMTITYQPRLENGMVYEGPVVDDHTSFDDLNHILTFGADGYLTHEVRYGRPGEWEETTFIGQTQATEIKKFTNGQLVQHTESTYNNDGRPTYSFCTQNGEPLYETWSEYNEKGLVVRHIHEHCKNPAYSTVRTHSYDAEGRLLVMETRKKLSGDLDSRLTKTYDEKGRIKETTQENWEHEKDDFNYREVPIYNEHNDQVGFDRFDLKKGELVKTMRYGQDYVYDAAGKRIIPEREEDDQFTFQDKEDEHGNWTWRLVLEDGSPRFVMVRQIQYEGEPRPEWEHPLQEVRITENEDHRKLNLNDRSRQPLNEEDVQFIYSQENLGPDHFPLLRYYSATFKVPPSLTTFSGNIEANEVLRYSIEHFGAKKVFSYRISNNGWRNEIRYTLEFGMYPGYLLHASQIHQANEEQFIVPSTMTNVYDEVCLSSFQFLSPPQDSEFYNDFFEEMVENMIDRMTLKKRPGKPKINLIEVRNNSYALVERPVHDNFTIRDLDINYGHGFEQFHNDLMARFNSSNKGLILFHGVPGTGKTYYIRHLLRQMALARKSVIYMPPNMVDHLTDPGFMTFLTNSVQNLSREGQFCVLLIEDAEPLLAKRQEGVRIQGVTNLLNMTDGLLNDMLNLQIICTFNVDLRKLDSALLRPGRLLARKEFKPLSVLDANLLGQRLGIKKHFNKPTSLGEIYALLQNQNTLVHDVEPTKNTSNPIDDLV